ncbi:hypothetical protein [Methylobacterium sp. J-070]|uniref:hypothetical protein n=1 Tax=Methylobacterium sp. J-070 TaxID=2836650 RepID=UPI001FB9EC8D|nr:hypothetical protein [Methylobacterium sp. J-070]MCJ2049320.1 hypothetical protein [Methylobacterium sp. J-070]
MTHDPIDRTDLAPTEGAVPARVGGGLLQGAAFVLLCLWTRTSPIRLRDQLSPEAGACATLGF